MEVQLSKLAGAYPVIAVGRSQWKIDLARQRDADMLVGAASEDPVAKVLELTDGRGADVVIEAVGTPATLQQCLDMTKPGGRVVVFGISPQPLPSLDLFRMYLTEKTMIFPRATTRADYYRTVELVASKRLDLKSLITQEYALEDAAHAFKFAEEEQSKVLRVVLNP
ncbi:MAG: zinc-binding dehydrogenase [Chloroflexi bacterium]|nr:zinc-binding dehydrogenase [Chloroflexota bacterium]